jgi:hypothetical protein
MTLLEFYKRSKSGQYKHKWITYIPSFRNTIINNCEYICEKCNALSDVKWPGGTCRLSDDEFIIKQIIE